MKQLRGAAPRLGINASDLAEWDALSASRGPFVSAYLDTAPREDPPSSLAAAWRESIPEVREQGAAPAAIAAIGGVVSTRQPGSAAVGVIADERGVVLTRSFDMSLGASRVSVGAVPLLTPLLEWMQAKQPHLVVLAQPDGYVEIALFDHTDPLPTFPTAGVQGEDDTEADAVATDVDEPADTDTDARENGSSTIDTGNGHGAVDLRNRETSSQGTGRWRATGEDAPTLIAQIAADRQVAVVAVSGDQDAVREVVQRLPLRVRELVSELDVERRAERAPDGDASTDPLVRLTRLVVADETVDVARTMAAELGPGGSGATTVDATLEALARARVETLFVHDDPDDQRLAYFSPDTTLLSVRRLDFGATDARPVSEGRLVDVAVFSALATRASVRVVPELEHLPAGLGAILRR